MGFAAEARQATRGVDGADVWADGLQGCEGAALGFDFAEDVFADADAEVCGCAGEPAALFVQQVGRYSLGLLRQVELMAPCFVEGANCFIDLFPSYRTAGFEPIGSGEFGAGSLLCGDVVA